MHTHSPINSENETDGGRDHEREREMEKEITREKDKIEKQEKK